MKVKSVLLQGNIDKSLKIPISTIEPDILSGKWQIAISSIAVTFNSDIDSTFLSVSSNFIIGKSVNAEEQLILSPTTLYMFHCGGKKGDKKMFSPASKEYFEVTNASSSIEFYFKNIENNNSVTGAKCFLLVYIRRIE